ncbi:AAA family ATPase [Vreelandella boliviensis]|jgi:predicted ATPase|uniref:AAA family ATPase n=1 Tax=Vreelandella boliviensis TaxID=223527 RepID=UPI001B8AD60D|nr:AAA family ATPase [Halomonas boliviensis]MBS3666620.1 AAA family ATPase [Halomonas boliviensis]
MNHRLVVTGGPGGGKTTLLSALEGRGYRVVPEAARRIIKERLTAGLSPRPDPVSFGQAILSSDIEKYRSAASCDHAVFFDRGVLDALYMLNAVGALKREKIEQYVQQFPYNGVVFLLPPWEEIYVTDSERDQSFEESIEVFEGLKKWYSQWGYEIVEVPRDNVNERVSCILQCIDTPNNSLLADNFSAASRLQN